jgi:hypothetical protein
MISLGSLGQSSASTTIFSTSLTGINQTSSTSSSYVTANNTIVPATFWTTNPNSPVFPPVGDPRPPIGFNKFLNASDLVEEFIKWSRSKGIGGEEALGIPIELFVKYLVLEATKADESPEQELLALPSPTLIRCVKCGRFMKRKLAEFRYCSVKCFERSFYAP